MKVGIIGGGIAGLSAAYYIKKFALPVSQIVLIESSSRYGGWMKSNSFIDETNGRKILFDYGPRTLRYAADNKELNTLSLALDLKLEHEMDLITNTHPAASKRYIYLNDKVNLIKPSLFFPSPIFGKPLFFTLFRELTARPRSADVQDESIYDFITRRTSSTISENILDPVMKGICGGNIKELSAASLLKYIYDGEAKAGSILKNFMLDQGKPKELYDDLNHLGKQFAGTSVWRFKNGMQTLSDTLVNHLKSFKDVQLNDNEECLKIDFNSKLNKMEVKTSKNNYDFDFVISSVYAKQQANFLSDDHFVLKELLNKIQAVNMVVINLYFDKNVLPVQGFGYLVPTKENSPILGCIFDSVFDGENINHSTLTVMMGGAFYEQYIGTETDHEKLLSLAMGALKKQLKFDLQPKKFEVSILKNCIPQYKVGHQSLQNEINEYLRKNSLNDKLYLIGSSYNGFSVNDIIFNSRVLCQDSLKNRLLNETPA